MYFFSFLTFTSNKFLLVILMSIDIVFNRSKRSAQVWHRYLLVFKSVLYYFWRGCLIRDVGLFWRIIYECSIIMQYDVILFVPLRKHLVSTLETDERVRARSRKYTPREAKFETGRKDDDYGTACNILLSLYTYHYTCIIVCSVLYVYTYENNSGGTRGARGGVGMRNGKQTGTIASCVGTKELRSR